jgi:hypothetical protein
MQKGQVYVMSAIPAATSLQNPLFKTATLISACKDYHLSILRLHDYHHAYLLDFVALIAA